MGFYQLVPTWDDKLMVSLHCRDPKEYFHLRALLRCESFRKQCQTKKPKKH
uniref:ORF50 n=2 Tax=Pinus subgen. Pinus TaxID=139271 RepID=A0A0U2A041_9CONI|nr:ORF50 [Pinus thunbergii]YP_009154180.1 ORF50 [Pinus taiwanensis]AKE32371.1 ORF50 [Pinus taiwanensis]BAA04432.1 ORF50 [Pinus thunbergii]